MKRKITLILLTLFIFSCETEFEDNFCPSLEGCVSDWSFRTFFSDDFNRADESPVAAPWNHVQEVVGDDFELLTNVLAPKRGAGNSPSAIYTTAITNGAVRVSVTATITGANFPAALAGEIIVLARTQLTTSVDDGYFCGIDPTTSRVTIGRTIGGGAAFLGASTGAFTLNNGDSFRITFTLVNSDITCTIVENGTTSLSATGTDSTFETGFTGVKGGKDMFDEVTFDDYLVEVGDP